MHSELSEALESYRKGEPLLWFKDGGTKPEGLAAEYADVVIRIATDCKFRKIDLERAIELKMEYITRWESGMIIELRVLDPDGNLIAEARGPVHQPVQWKSPPGHPLVVERPANEQGTPNGAYKIWSITATPNATLDLLYKEIGEGIGQPVQQNIVSNGTGTSTPVGVPLPVEIYPSGYAGNKPGSQQLKHSSDTEGNNPSSTESGGTASPNLLGLRRTS